jgi:hypothetical protein
MARPPRAMPARKPSCLASATMSTAAISGEAARRSGYDARR